MIFTLDSAESRIRPTQMFCIKAKFNNTRALDEYVENSFVALRTFWASMTDDTSMLAEFIPHWKYSPLSLLFLEISHITHLGRLQNTPAI